MDRRRDPRSIVTPYAFAVHPDLLGRPLATPMQRLGAILVDLIVIGIISQVGGAPLAFASALLLLWLAFKKPSRDVFGKLFRIAVGCLGVFVLVIAILVVVAVRYGEDYVRSAVESVPEVTEEGVEVTPAEGVSGPEESGEPNEVGVMDVIQSAQGVMAFRNAETPDQARTIAGRLARNGLELGFSRSDIRSSMVDLIPEDASWAGEADEIIDEAIAAITSPEASPAGAPDSALSDPNAAEEEGPAAITEPAALDSIDALREEVADLEEARDRQRQRADEAEAALAQAESGGLFDWLRSIIDELGLGFGWAALYLTITHAWWKGTSVGKRLFRIRVVMIDKRPLNWWLSFERAGGYAAGFATGLLGFAQIFWDPNRQAIHDKVSETIVIRDGAAPIPGPWIEEGKAQWAGDREAGGNPT